MEGVIGMSQGELVYAIGQIDKELTRNEEVLAKYRLERKDNIDPEIWDLLNRLGEVSSYLIRTRDKIATDLRDNYGIFII